MGIVAVEEFANILPYSLKEQVLGYARSVRDAMKEIMQEAEVEYTDEIANKIIFIAGVRKLYSICNSSYWVLENTNSLLQESNVYNVRVGGTDMSKGSEFYKDIKILTSEIDKYLSDKGIKEEVISYSYPDLIRMYANGRRPDR